MKRELFTKKLIELRKKNHYKQQEVADKLNISNKTISRWETGESYADIETLLDLASLYHVTTDYLLNDHENFIDLQKTDITGFVPWIIGILAVLIYYLCEIISIPCVLSFLFFYFIIKFSYNFFYKYTNNKNHLYFVYMNTLTSFFVFHSFIRQILLFFATAMMANSMMVATITMTDLDFSSIVACSFLGYCSAFVYAYFHYKNHIKKKEGS